MDVSLAHEGEEMVPTLLEGCMDCLDIAQTVSVKSLNS